MTQQSPNFGFKFIQPAQAQKHLVINEGLRRLDHLGQITFQYTFEDQPPAQIEDGENVLVSDTPQDDFSGHANEIAMYYEQTWHFVSPSQGWIAYFAPSKEIRVFDGANWDLLTLNTAENFGVNADADENNRFIVRSAQCLFDHEGMGHQLKINKANESAIGSILFQSDYAGRVELGLIGEDSFSIKTSKDGVHFEQALRVDDSGATFPMGRDVDMLIDSTANSGTPNENLGPPNLTTIALSRENLNLSKDRVYFFPFFVDRPTRICGGNLALHQAAELGSVIRSGLFKLGNSEWNSWIVGELLADYGTIDAATAGHKSIKHDPGIVVGRGWYLHALGCNGANASVRAVEWATPGTFHYEAFDTGVSADLRICGAARYLFDTEHGALIENGFPTQWPNAVKDVVSAEPTSLQALIPYWDWPNSGS